MDWQTLLAYITGAVDDQLLLRLESLGVCYSPVSISFMPVTPSIVMPSSRFLTMPV